MPSLFTVKARVKPVIPDCRIKAFSVGGMFDLERHGLVDKALPPVAGVVQLVAVEQVYIAVMRSGVSFGFHRQPHRKQ